MQFLRGKGFSIFIFISLTDHCEVVQMFDLIFAGGFLIAGACVGGFFVYIFCCKKRRAVTTPGVIISPPPGEDDIP